MQDVTIIFINFFLVKYTVKSNTACNFPSHHSIWTEKRYYSLDDAKLVCDELPTCTMLYSHNPFGSDNQYFICPPGSTIISANNNYKLYKKSKIF
jgi:hypothetical protein